MKALQDSLLFGLSWVVHALHYCKGLAQPINQQVQFLSDYSNKQSLIPLNTVSPWFPKGLAMFRLAWRWSKLVELGILHPQFPTFCVMSTLLALRKQQSNNCQHMDYVIKQQCLFFKFHSSFLIMIKKKSANFSGWSVHHGTTSKSEDVLHRYEWGLSNWRERSFG